MAGSGDGHGDWVLAKGEDGSFPYERSCGRDVVVAFESVFEQDTSDAMVLFLPFLERRVCFLVCQSVKVRDMRLGSRMGY